MHSEMGLQAVLSPSAVCPSFSIRLGDAVNVCWVWVGEQYVIAWCALANVAAASALHVMTVTCYAGSPVASVHQG